MPAFSHCFLKRFMAFSNDSPSLTRTPGILGITTLRGIHAYPAFLRAREYTRGRRSVKRCSVLRLAARDLRKNEELRGARLGLRGDRDRLGGLAGAIQAVAQLLAGAEEDAALG